MHAQMMQNLLVEEGAVVTISSATLPKGAYVKLQPHTSVRPHWRLHDSMLCQASPSLSNAARFACSTAGSSPPCCLLSCRVMTMLGCVSMCTGCL